MMSWSWIANLRFPLNCMRFTLIIDWNPQTEFYIGYLFLCLNIWLIYKMQSPIISDYPFNSMNNRLIKFCNSGRNYAGLGIILREWPADRISLKCFKLKLEKLAVWVSIFSRIHKCKNKIIYGPLVAYHINCWLNLLCSQGFVNHVIIFNNS